MRTSIYNVEFYGLSNLLQIRILKFQTKKVSNTYLQEVYAHLNYIKVNLKVQRTSIPCRILEITHICFIVKFPLFGMFFTLGCQDTSTRTFDMGYDMPDRLECTIVMCM